MMNTNLPALEPVFYVVNIVNHPRSLELLFKELHCNIPVINRLDLITFYRRSLAERVYFFFVQKLPVHRQFTGTLKPGKIHLYGGYKKYPDLPFKQLFINMLGFTQSGFFIAVYQQNILIVRDIVK